MSGNNAQIHRVFTSADDLRQWYGHWLTHDYMMLDELPDWRLSVDILDSYKGVQCKNIWWAKHIVLVVSDCPWFGGSELRPTLTQALKLLRNNGEVRLNISLFVQPDPGTVYTLVPANISEDI